MWRRTRTIKEDYPLSIRVLVAILAISTLLALLTGVIQLRMHYASQMVEFEQRLGDVPSLFVPSLTDALWRQDTSLIATSLEALNHLPFVNHTTLRTREGARYTSGAPVGGEFIRIENFPLRYYTPEGPLDLGTLTLEIDRKPIFMTLRRDALIIFTIQGLKTLIASLLILWLLHRMLFRHLLRLRETATRLNPERMDGAFILDRHPVASHDELEDLRLALETMRSCIGKGLITLKQLHAERERISQAANAAPSALLIFDASGTPHYHNPAFEAYFNPSGNPQSVGDWLEVLQGEQPREWTLQALVETVRRQGQWQQEAFWQPPHSPPRWLDLKVVRYLVEDNEYFCLNAVDVTDLRSARKRERHLLERDRLTGLPNRTLGVMQLETLLRQACHEHTHVAVVLVAVKAFKAALETLGLEYADLLILNVSKTIRQLMPEEAQLSRTSDNAFLCAFVLTTPDAQPVVDYLEGLRERLIQPIKLQDQRVDPDFCAGVAISPNDGERAETLLKHAHSALRQAQLQERITRWRFFDPHLYGQASRRLRLATQITSGQLLNELVLHYQPIVAGHDKTLRGFEALARWPSEALGPVSPTEFIAVAEQLGVIDQLGEEILQRACREAAHWRGQGQHLFVGVNVSPRQLEHPNFVRTVSRALQMSGLPPSALKLEITEQVILRPHQQVLSQLQTLNNLGVTLAIDDFGTGYASLNYLYDYPFKVLKIDQSFVLRMLADNAGYTLVKAVIHLAHELGLSVVAEGVETEAVSSALGELKCELLQGFIFSHPMAAAQLTPWLRHQMRG